MTINATPRRRVRIARLFGGRGAYFYARTGSGVLNPGAFAYLEVQ